MEEKNATKLDVSKFNENSIIYKKFNKNPIIIEDETLKDRNKVKLTLYRYIFTNIGQNKRYFRGEFKCEKNESDRCLEKINCFIPPLVKDVVHSKNISNFYNVSRIKGNLPFLKSDDYSININFEKNIWIYNINQI